MKKFNLPFWKDAPFIRVVLPFIAGILINHYCNPAGVIPAGTFLLSLVGLLLFSWLRLKWQYGFNWVRGVVLNLMVCSAGALVAFVKNPFRNQGLIDRSDETIYVASIGELPLEKKASWKALSELTAIRHGDTTSVPDTDIIVYFRKDSIRPPPPYGSKVAFREHPEEIKNFLPDSSFDYRWYCALKNIHYQVFLKSSEYVVLQGNDKNEVREFLFSTQQWVLGVLRGHIAGKKECGLAEALLIGYRNDLDRSLMQSYSNTGVVHVVAISGLHLGLIYGMLNMLCAPLARRRIGNIMRPVVILAGLWTFSLLAGGSPSIVRSAVMFSFVVIGQSVSRNSSLLNNLAASGFLLLCYDPYWLWDLGFLLSYGALLSIALFMKPVYALYIPDNPLLDAVWKLNAVTLSAQILTLPVLVYNFGQFPTLFLVTNSIAIPLSSIILVGEIVLCSVYLVGPVAQLTGKILETLIAAMNGVVEYLDSFPFSSITGINISALQVVLLYVTIFLVAGKLKTWQKISN